MEDHSTPPLFDLKARRLTWRLSAHLLHFSDGLLVTHYTRTTIQPFQVVTYHVDEIPSAWLVEQGQYETFRAAMVMLAHSKTVKEAMTPPKRRSRFSEVPRTAKESGPVAYPSWWVE